MKGCVSEVLAFQPGLVRAGFARCVADALSDLVDASMSSGPLLARQGLVLTPYGGGPEFPPRIQRVFGVFVAKKKELLANNRTIN